MRPDLPAMLESFRTDAEVAPARIMMGAFLKLSRQDQVELLAYLVIALMHKWEAEAALDQRGRQAIKDMLDLNDMVRASREPRQ